MTLKEMNAKISAFQKVMEIIETKIAEENGYKSVKAIGILDHAVYFRIEKETEDGPELRIIPYFERQ